jgi:hypothetical protein
VRRDDLETDYCLGERLLLRRASGFSVHLTVRFYCSSLRQGRRCMVSDKRGRASHLKPWTEMTDSINGI